MAAEHSDEQAVRDFFEAWLPETFARLANKEPNKVPSDCSLVAEVGSLTFTASVRAGALSVVQGRQPGAEATFAVRTSLEAFTRLLPDRDALRKAEDRFGHLLRLDAETVRLVAAVPGALRVRVNDAATSLDVVLGPGKADLSAPRCTVVCQFSDFQDLQAQRQNPMDLFLAGKLVLDGDLEVALALGGLVVG